MWKRGDAHSKSEKMNEWSRVEGNEEMGEENSPREGTQVVEGRKKVTIKRGRELTEDGRGSVREDVRSIKGGMLGGWRPMEELTVH